MCPRRSGAAALVAAALTAASARAAEYETVVVARGTPQPVSASVGGKEARQLPGTGGDPSAAATNLPGVARPAPGATGLVMWGAAPAESRVLYEGVELPALYHFGGFRSAVGAELVGRIDVVPGAFGAEYGRAVGGLVRVDARPIEREGAHLVLDTSLLDTSLALRAAPLAGLRVGAAVRASTLAETYGHAVPTDATALFPIPRYADAQLDATVDVAPGATLRALVLASTDAVTRSLGAATPGLPERTERRGLRWWRAALLYAERGGQLGNNDGLAATLYAGGDESTLDQRFGAAPALQDVSASSAGLRARYRVQAADGVRLTLGLDGWAERARVRRAGSLTVPAREGDVTAFGQPPGDDVNADTWTATVGDVGAYATLALTRGPFTLTPGLRADAFPVDGDRLLPPVGATPRIGYARLDWALDPRLALAWAARSGLVVTAAGGVYHQPADARDLSAVFGTPTLGPSRALHASLSAWKALPARFALEAVAFYRALDHLPVRSPLATPVLAQALTSDGRGRAYGASVFLRRDLTGGTTAWLTYTFSRSERWSAGGTERLLDYDQTHVLAAVASHQVDGWTFGARARYATGMPRTPVPGSFLDATDGTHQPLFGPHNGVRLPAFFQLDARVDRAFVLGPVTATLYLDVQNVTARGNAEEIVYSHDYSSSGYFTGPPLLALLGLRIES